ncbi:glycerol kinase GlpK [Alphaproteobacteria bacterium]|nr:glycerol kinase GlpK [Alphaproteobacteria bacterium]
MSDKRSIIAIDQGTTSSRAILFDEDGNILAQKSAEFAQIFPQDGWVEHDPEAIWQTVVEVTSAMVDAAQHRSNPPIAIGITNQRETAIIWDRATGRPIHNAIVWQDRRTADICAVMKNAGNEAIIQAKTGLLLDPYFTATKYAWILDRVEDARARAEAGELCFGTVDSFLLWRLTGGKMHATDATNASRTSLYNIHENDWDDDLLDLFGVPRSGLPQVMDCAAEFGVCDTQLFGTAIPIRGIAGDQQAAAIGQGCFTPGALKSTYGTGCFVIINTGDAPVASGNKLLTTIGYRLNGKTSYALEGSIFVSGAIVQWLRDGLQIIKSAGETENIARAMDGNNGVYMVPALTGLGAPHWSPNARGAIYGITRDTDPADFVRAALESVAYQTNDLFTAIAADGIPVSVVRVDGGMTENNWLMQFLADIIDLPVDRPAVRETTALGAAMLALMQSDAAITLDDLAARWQLDASFTPAMHPPARRDLIAGWQAAMQRTLLKC